MTVVKFPAEEFAHLDPSMLPHAEIGWQNGTISGLVRELKHTYEEIDSLRARMISRAAEYEQEIDDLRAQLRNR